MSKKYICNNCNKSIDNGCRAISTRLFLCNDCNFILAISNGQIYSISIELNDNLSFRSGSYLGSVYAYFISNGNVPTPVRYGVFRSCERRKCDSVPTPFLVLFSPGSLCLCFDRFRCDQRAPACFCTQTPLWI